MQEIEITLRPGKENLELHEFLTISGIASSGGNAKHIIQDGNIQLNNETETRKRKKLKNNDIITHNNQEYKLILE